MPGPAATANTCKHMDMRARNNDSQRKIETADYTEQNKDSHHHCRHHQHHQDRQRHQHQHQHQTHHQLQHIKVVIVVITVIIFIVIILITIIIIIRIMFLVFSFATTIPGAIAIIIAVKPRSHRSSEWRRRFADLSSCS